MDTDREVEPMVEPGAISIQYSDGAQPSSALTVREAPQELSAATLLHWCVFPGDLVEQDQEILLIAEGQCLRSVSAPTAGTLLAHWSEAGDPVAAGETLGWIRPLQHD
jgi:biotin carboxyl carrier protein